MRDADDRIVEFLRFSAGSDRPSLSRELDLPAATVTSAVRKLLAAGRIVLDAAAERGGAAGRPRQPLRIAGPAPLLGLVGWDLDRLSVRLLAPDATVLDTWRLPLPEPDHETGGLGDAVASLVTAAAARDDTALAAAVVSTPTPSLHGHGAPPEHLGEAEGPRRFAVTTSEDVEGTLSARFGLPVLLENDANLAAMGERVAGGRPSDHFLSITLNERGFGGALVVHGDLVRGARGYAGEFAHLQVDPDGPVCQCGGRGCLGIMIRGLAVSATSGAYPRPLTFAELPARAAEGDLGAARMLRDVGRTIGRPIAQLCTLLDPDHVVVDSTLGPQIDHVLRGMRESMSLGAPPAIADNVAIVRSDLGARAELVGAVEMPREAARRG